MSLEEAELYRRRSAYIDQLRALYRRERYIGMGLIVAGAALVVAQRFVWSWPHWLIWAGYGLIAVGWVLFVVVILRRTAWRRANPFDPERPLEDV